MQVVELTSITEDEFSTDIAIGEDEGLAVYLAGNASTGFEWNVHPPANLILVSSETLYTHTGLVGSGNTCCFRFQTTGVVTGELIFLYSQPWDTGDPLKQYTLAVN